MTISRKTLAALALVTSALTAATVPAQVEVPRSAARIGRDTAAVADSTGVTKAVASRPADGPLTLRADLSARMLTVMQGDTKIKTYSVAVGSDRYPTPPGKYSIRKIVWNPSWHPP